MRLVIFNRERFYRTFKVTTGFLAVLLTWTGIFSPLAFSSEAKARVDWEYRDGVSGAHPGQMEVLPSGNLLLVLNGFINSRVIEVDRDKKVVWRHDVQANSAVRLENGNTLISESGAPGKPLIPRVVEVTPAGQVVWNYELPSLADAPRYSQEMSDGNILITTRNKILKVNRAGETLFQVNADQLTDKKGINALPILGQKYDKETEKTASSELLHLTNLVSAKEQVDGSILVVDEGIRTGGRVIELDQWGNLIREWGNQKLVRPKEAVRTEDGKIIIADLGSYNYLMYSQEGDLKDIVSWRQVITELPVLNQWGVSLLPNGHLLLGLSYTNGQSLVVEINDKIPQVLLNGEEFLLGVEPFMVDGRMFAPANQLFSSLGIRSHWDNVLKQVTAVKGDKKAVFATGSTEMTVDGRTVDMGSAPRLVNNTTYIPVRLLQQAFGIDLEWDGSTRTLNIVYPH